MGHCEIKAQCYCNNQTTIGENVSSGLQTTLTFFFFFLFSFLQQTSKVGFPHLTNLHTMECENFPDFPMDSIR